MNIEKRTAILYEAFYLLKAISDCFSTPLSPNEKRAFALIEEFDDLVSTEKDEETEFAKEMSELLKQYRSAPTTTTVGSTPQPTTTTTTTG